MELLPCFLTMFSLWRLCVGRSKVGDVREVCGGLQATKALPPASRERGSEGMVDEQDERDQPQHTCWQDAQGEVEGVGHLVQTLHHLGHQQEHQERHPHGSKHRDEEGEQLSPWPMGVYP